MEKKNLIEMYNNYKAFNMGHKHERIYTANKLKKTETKEKNFWSIRNEKKKKISEEEKSENINLFA
jgi:hypothetical protein